MRVPVGEWFLAIVAEHESYRLAVEEDSIASRTAVHSCRFEATRLLRRRKADL